MNHERRVNSVKWASGHAVLRRGDCGPAHDPYGYDVVDLTLGDKHYRLMSCGLRGQYIEGAEGEILAALAEPMNCDKDERAALRDQYDAEVASLTGYPPYFWEYKLWEYV